MIFKMGFENSEKGGTVSRWSLSGIYYFHTPHHPLIFGSGRLVDENLERLFLLVWEDVAVPLRPSMIAVNSAILASKL